MAEMNMAEALNSALSLALEKDGKIVMLGEDIGVDGGVFRITQGLMQKFGAERVIDTPISEAAIIGTSVGMAIYGLKPVPEIQFSGFIYPAFQEMISHVSRLRNRSRGTYTCHMVIRTPYGGGINALEHHSESLEALFVHIPGLKVVIPSNPYDAKGLLLASINDPDPVLFMEPKKLYRAFKQEVPEEYYEIPLSKANIRKEGKDVTLVSWGAMMPVLEDAAEQADVSCELIDLRTLDPWDYETVAASVNKTGRAIVVHEATRTGGFGAEIAATIQELCLLKLLAPVERLTAPDVIVPLLKLEEYYRPNAAMLVEKIKKVMSF